MKGFKVVSENHIHHGFKYQEGLNVDPNPFRPKGSCVAGGLYFFTNITDIAKWVRYGVYLYEVEVPTGRRYVKDPDGDKYRSKYLILSNPLDLREVTTWEYLIQQGADIHAMDDYALRWEAYYGHLDVVKFLVEKGADIHNDDDVALRFAAQKGHLEVVKYLVSAGADIHARGDAALRWSVDNGHLEVVKYLVEKGADVFTWYGVLLSSTVYGNHLEVRKYLISARNAEYKGYRTSIRPYSKVYLLTE